MWIKNSLKKSLTKEKPVVQLVSILSQDCSSSGMLGMVMQCILEWDICSEIKHQQEALKKKLQTLNRDWIRKKEHLTEINVRLIISFFGERLYDNMQGVPKRLKRAGSAVSQHSISRLFLKWYVRSCYTMYSRVGDVLKSNITKNH